MFIRFEPKIMMKESLKVLDKFPKLTAKQFYKLYKEALVVVDSNPNVMVSPEEIFNNILRISNKKIPLIPDQKKKNSVRMLSHSQGDQIELRRREKSQKLPSLFQKKETSVENGDRVEEDASHRNYNNRLSNKHKIQFVLSRLSSLSSSSGALHQSISNRVPALDLEMLAAHPIKPEQVETGGALYKILIRQYYKWKDKKSDNSGAHNTVDWV